MPKLRTESQLDQKTAPFTQKWDTAMRQNHAHFQELIDKQAYEIQRGTKSLIPIFGSWTFPYSSQRNFVLKDLYTRYQLLGEIFDEEIEEYSAQNPDIREDLKITFNTPGLRIKESLLAGLGLNAIAFVTRATAGMRALLFILPVSYQMVYNRTRTDNQFKSLEFFDYCLQQRTCRARAELDTSGVLDGVTGAKSLLVKENPDMGVKDAYLALFNTQ